MNRNKVKYSPDMKYNISIELMKFMNIFVDKKVSERDIIIYIVNYIKYYNLLDVDNKIRIDNKLSKLLDKKKDIMINYMDVFNMVKLHIVSNS